MKCRGEIFFALFYRCGRKQTNAGENRAKHILPLRYGRRQLQGEKRAKYFSPFFIGVDGNRQIQGENRAKNVSPLRIMLNEI